MTKPFHWIILISACLGAAWIIFKTGSSAPRSEMNIDLNWRFTNNDSTSFSSPDYDHADWKIVSLPHDWMIEKQVDKENPSGTRGGYYPGGIGWYRKQLNLTHLDDKKQFYLVFDGVYMNADVWINGHLLGHHSYGYIGFRFDITPYVRTDTINTLAVRTDCSELPVDRWYSGAGIYRHVKLIATNVVHFPDHGLKITTKKKDASTHHIVATQSVINNSKKTRRVRLRFDLLDTDGHLIDSKVTTRVLSKLSTNELQEDFLIENPTLWSPDQPEQYTLNVFITHNRQIIDNTEQLFGIREARFSSDSGFVLNGDKLWLKGVCLHHDGGELGAAVPEATWHLRLKTLKQLGVNALRLAHNPHAPEVLDMCDSMGFLVINEMYDKWELQKDGGDSHFNFSETFHEDLSYFVNRDYNHPSVIAWSVGNETIEQRENPELGQQWYRMLMETVLENDTTRMVTCGLHPGGSNRAQIPSSFIHISPLVSYNYKTDSFAVWHKRFPDKIWLASETKRYNEKRPENFEEINYLDNSWLDMDTFVAGQFIWAGIDYLGESMGWPDRGLRNGLLETNGNIKPGSYFTQSIYSEKPMVKIAVLDPMLADSLNKIKHWQAAWFDAPVVRHWDFNSTQKELQIVVYTNCEEVELTVNGGQSIVKKKTDFQDQVIKTKVKYTPGLITAIASYIDKNGNTAYVSDSLVTSGKPVKIAMNPDKEVMEANGKDIVHIKTIVTDAKGTKASQARNLIRYMIEGPGKIRVIDNGNLADHTPYGSNEKEVYHGTQTLIVQSTIEPGDLIIKASSEGLEPAEINLKSIHKK